MSRLTWFVMAAALGVGCMQSTHRIHRGELTRLAQTDPAARGQQVRVVQDLVGEQPPSAEPVSSDTHVTVVVVGGHHHDGPAYRRHRDHPPTRPQARDHRGDGGATSTSQSGGGSGGGKGVTRGVADAKADDARALFVLAAIAGVALAVTEGARYDGWVEVHPMHPVHLWGPGGYVVVPLAEIDPETAAWAERAVIVPQEGPWRRLGRAPLDRQGFTYSVMMGVGTMISGDGSEAVGTTGRVQLGYFPVHAIGLQLDWGFGWRENAVEETLFDSRLGLEATFAPLDVGKLHGGVFGGLALASRFEDGVPGGRDDGTALTAGALLQLELTTRLALTGRFGLSSAYGDSTSDAQIGLSIY